MRFGKQTLAWVNQSYRWIRRTLPTYVPPRRGAGLAENGLLPDTAPSTYIMIYYNGKERPVRSEGDGWGLEKWHHSINLVDNECQCDRCLGISDEWDEYDIIKRKIKEVGK